MVGDARGALQHEANRAGLSFTRSKRRGEALLCCQGTKTAMLSRLLAALFVTVMLAPQALAAPCGGNFNSFIAAFSRDAQAAGVSRATIDQALTGVTPDPSVLAFDRRQRGMFHTKSFEEYAATRVTPARLKRARALMQRHAQLLARIERQFGVPRTLLMGIWPLEADKGRGGSGQLPVIRTLAPPPHDWP